jgi:small conductance mechanosensitive channel
MDFQRELEMLTRTIADWLFTSGLRIVFILIGALVIRRILNGLARRIRHAVPGDGTATEQEKRLATLLGLLETAIGLGVWVTAWIMILHELRIPIGPVLASAGIAGLAIGFGAQNLVRDVVAGFFMLLENQYGEGDVIQAAGVAGTVERFGLRVTVLRDLDGRVHYIPNGEIKLVSNLTKDYAQAVIDVEAAYGEDVDRVIALLRRLAGELRADPAFAAAIRDAEVPGIERFAETAVVVRVLFRTAATENHRVGREFRRRVLRACAEEGIEIFPRRTLTIDPRRPGRPAALATPAEPGPGPGPGPAPAIPPPPGPASAPAAAAAADGPRR